MLRFVKNITKYNFPKAYYILTFISVCVIISVIQKFKHASTMENTMHTTVSVNIMKSEKQVTPCDRMDLNVNYPKPSIVASFGQGRTANQLCYFASGYALWREYGILNFVDREQLDLLEKTFVLPKLKEENNNSPYYLWREGKLLGKIT